MIHSSSFNSFSTFYGSARTRSLILLVTTTALLSIVSNVWLLFKHQELVRLGFPAVCYYPISNNRLPSSGIIANEKEALDVAKSETTNENEATTTNSQSQNEMTNSGDAIVDAVITYVNGEEPSFQREFVRYRKESKIKYSVAKSRFEDHGDLRILLRSLDVYGQMFRYIFLVVANPAQVPKWLNINCERLRIVYHRDMWSDPFQLPVFNSLAIEANLHHIEGLAEDFVYFNDDLTLVNEVQPEDWFWEIRRPIRKRLAILYRADSLKLPKRVSKTGSDSHWLGPALVTRYVTMDLCNEGSSQKQEKEKENQDKQHTRLAFGKLPKHTPHLLMRSVLKKAEKDARFSALFNATSRSRFRSGKELNAVMLFYAYAECKLNMSIVLGTQTEVAYMGINHGAKGNVLQKYHGAMRYYEKGIRQGNRKFICFNDVTDLKNVTDEGREGAEAAYKWRANFFPKKSSFET